MAGVSNNQEEGLQDCKSLIMTLRITRLIYCSVTCGMVQGAGAGSSVGGGSPAPA